MKGKYFQFVPILVFIVLLAATFFTWRFTQNIVTAETSRSFHQEVQVVKHWIQDRLNLYLPITLSTRIFFESSDKITVSEWSAYIQRLKLIDKYPGISSISYIERVADSDLLVFASQLEPGFTVHPQTKKAEYYIVKYIETLSEDKTIIGSDLSADPTQLTLLNDVRDEDPTSAGRVTLLVTPLKGFEILLPVYRKGPYPTTVNERRQALKGFIQVKFTGSRLFQDIFETVDSSNLSFKIYSGQPNLDNLLFNQGPDYAIANPRYRPEISTHDTFDFNGQTWTIVAETKSDFKLIPSQQRLPLVVLIGGLIFSFIFLIIFLTLSKYRHHS